MIKSPHVPRHRNRRHQTATRPRRRATASSMRCGAAPSFPPTARTGFAGRSRRRFRSCLRTLNEERDELRGVGIGFGGPVDDATRTVIKSHQIAGWDGFPLADWIADLVGLPAVLGNDADVAGLAEKRSSAPARGCRRSSTSPSAPASAAGSSSTAKSIAAADAGRRRSGICIRRTFESSQSSLELRTMRPVGPSEAEWARERFRKIPVFRLCNGTPTGLTAKDVDAARLRRRLRHPILMTAWTTLAERLPGDRLALPAPHRHRRRRLADGRGVAVRAAAKKSPSASSSRSPIATTSCRRHRRGRSSCTGQRWHANDWRDDRMMKRISSQWEHVREKNR